MSETTQADFPPRPAPVPFAAALRYWLKLGFISFGGPAGQIALMHEELVVRRRWISERRFLHALNYCMVLPGPEAQQLATYIGWLMHGAAGGIAAGLLFVLPSLLLISGLAGIYLIHGDLPAVAAILYGVKPAVVAIVLFAAHRIGTRTIKNLPLAAIAAAAFIGIFALGVPFPLIVVMAALFGIIGGRVMPGQFQIGGGYAANDTAHAPAIIDDDTATPTHARFNAFRALRLAAAGLGLWGGALSALFAFCGRDGVLTQMAWLFTKAALLTFGGAYAVLPYVYQAAVVDFHWLTGAQMIDGLALGETTPGPLIMIVAFVGFVGGWTAQLLGSDSLLLAGICGALVATYFTFLPSFVFVLAGGPLVEATHGDLKFTAPLTAITAAVVGVIVNLALFFALHVLWPDGIEGRFDWSSLLIALAAATALFHFRVGVIPLIGGAAATGLVLRLLV